VTRLYDLGRDRSWDLGEGGGMAVFSADGRRVFLTLSGYIGQKSSALKVFDDAGKEVAEMSRLDDGRRFSSPVLSPDGKTLAVSVSKGRIDEPGTLRLYDTATNKLTAEFATGGKFPFHAAVFSPDGKRLATGDYGHHVSLWDLGKKELLWRHAVEKMHLGHSLAFDARGERLAGAAYRPREDEDEERDPEPEDLPQPRVLLFDLGAKGGPRELVCPPGHAGGVTFSADGKTLAVGGAGAVHLFDVSGAKK
jgi:WD40 repeat protein